MNEKMSKHALAYTSQWKMSKEQTVWIVDDDKSIRWVLEKALSKHNVKIKSFSEPLKVLNKISTETPDVIISDIRMPGMDGIELLERIKNSAPDVPVIIMTAYSDLDRAVSAFREGAFEYISKPFDVDEVVNLVTRAIQEKEIQQPADSTEPPGKIEEIIGSAPAMQEVFRAIARLSNSDLTVLITGDSGTGKELVAKALHRHSPRADKPFIALNTAAVTRELLESELFGHEKGAFTGATGRRTGRFEQANGGTLFLDEIGDMPPELQTRLLRVLANEEFYSVGGRIPVKVDVRIIAATNQDLEQRVEEGAFREDLLHRLNVIRVHVPPLKERREDIIELAEYFLNNSSQELKVERKIILPETGQYLSKLEWPGNVRQLENFCRWVTVMASSREIRVEDLPPELLTREVKKESVSDWEQKLRQWVEVTLQQGKKNILDTSVPKFERIMIEEALKQTGGKRQEAAVLLGWGRNTLTRKIKELAIENHH